MSKVRCGSCGEFINKEDAVRNGVQSFCPEHVAAAYQKTRPKRSKKKDIPDDLRDFVLRLDNGRCRWCGRSSDVVLHLHHVFYRSEQGPHEQSNLITLCLGHHDKVHANKPVYQPLCLGIIWLRAFGDRTTTIPKLERKMNAIT